MPDLRVTLPAALARQARLERLGSGAPGDSIPALLAHPDWSTPAPVMIWLHGRTVSKELDNGRYLRWIRAGIAACAIDLPGHGDRFDATLHTPERTLDLLERTVAEIDRVVEALADPRFGSAFDLDRIGLGGMSAGGMATLRRLADPHTFRCAAVEGTAGNLAMLYAGRESTHPPAQVARLDPMSHLDRWRPLPLLALHSEADAVVPVACVRTFIDALRAHHAAAGADADLVRLRTWPHTGAPMEHNGFGLVANDAKTEQIEFLSKHLIG